MRFILVILAFLIMLSCKSTQVNTEESAKNDWQEVFVDLEYDAILPARYRTYLLNFDSFNLHLQNGMIELPYTDGSFSIYEVKPSSVMSPALQEKFPNIRAYEGHNLDNKLCQCRIERKENVMSFAIFCNDATYYISKLPNTEFYFFYNKKDLP